MTGIAILLPGEDVAAGSSQESGEHPMRKLLVLVALGTVIAGPAFAQHDPNDPNDPRAGHRGRAFNQQRSTIPLYAGDI
jgi:hypothetical protein